MSAAATNARWIGAIQLSKIGAQLLTIVVLSRLLQPSEFGLVALASAISGFALLFRDFGTGPALIQKSDLDEATQSAAYWLNIGLGVGLGLVLLIAAPLMALLMDAPALTGLLAVLACTFPIAGASIVRQVLLERANRFAVVARIEIVALAVGFTVAVIAALAGAGAYSLVLQTLTITALTALQAYFASGWKPSRTWSPAHMRGLWRFSRDMLAFNLVNYFARNADSLIIGKVLGPASLGVYSLAYRTMLFPLQNLTFVATRALFPVMSRKQTEPQEVASMYLRSISVITFFTAPLMAGLFVLREPFVDAVFGSSWGAAASVIAWLAPVGFIQSIVSASGPVFMALGRTTTMLRITVIASLAHVTAFIVGLRWGVAGVAACYFVTNCIMAVPTLMLVTRCVNSNLGALFAAARRPILMSLAMGFALFAARSEVSSLDFPLLVELTILIGAGGALYFALAHFVAGALERDVFRALLKKA
jgi:O-antigen/teichoic acid export membrane protein